MDYAVCLLETEHTLFLEKEGTFWPPQKAYQTFTGVFGRGRLGAALPNPPPKNKLTDPRMKPIRSIFDLELERVNLSVVANSLLYAPNYVRYRSLDNLMRRS
jgi:hypothetical protein